MKNRESLDKYFLIMKQLCSRDNIEDVVVIRFVINAINEKKSILYGCQTIHVFSEKLILTKSNTFKILHLFFIISNNHVCPIKKNYGRF